MFRKLILLILILPINLLANNYYPANFENEIKGNSLKDQVLKDKLFSILNSYHQKVSGKNDLLVTQCSGPDCYGQTILGYSKAKDFLFGLIDLKKDNRGYYVRDVYCHVEYSGPDVGQLKTPKARVVNCEHSWPQSLFSKNFNNEMQKSDLHHLFIAKNDANMARSSNPFGDNNGKAAVPGCESSTIGGARNSVLVFEPPREHKGNLARAMLYFSVRYKLPIDRFQEDTFRAWNKDDPVTAEDITRNDLIQSLQGNRNPFVDYPEMIEMIADF